MIRCHDNSLYTGITKDIKKRIQEHYYKKGNCAKYTRARDVVSLDALWRTATRSDAAKMEYTLKKLTKQAKEALILNPNKIADSTYICELNITLESCLER